MYKEGLINEIFKEDDNNHNNLTELNNEIDNIVDSTRDVSEAQIASILLETISFLEKLKKLGDILPVPMSLINF